MTSSTTTHKEVRAWLERAHSASLATILADSRAAGTPFATIVPFALEDAPMADAEWRALIFISELAVHTKNLRADPRASLLFAEPSREEDPWGGWRVTLVGRMRLLEAAEGERATHVFRARHLAAARELPHDFSAWTLDIDATRYIAGFGRMGWL